MHGVPAVSPRFAPEAQAVVFAGDCLHLLRQVPDGCIQLVVTSPPYNIGKSYEKRDALPAYLDFQRAVIAESVRVLRPGGSICWQVGNYVDRKQGSIVPLDILLYPLFAGHGLRMRNRIIWHFEHGLHCQRRFSGRHETVMWFTKGDDYRFNLDPVRVPPKYPGKKYFKGPRAGQLSCNPLGKNPGDVWIIPNVKHNHVEKTEHPCQFPVELVERLVVATTVAGEWVLDPFAGVGSSMVAAVKQGRRGAGAELLPRFAAIAQDRVARALQGELATRPMHTPVYDPRRAGKAQPQRPVAESETLLLPLEAAGR